MKKQLISSIASLAIIMNTIGFNLTANAKVIEPEIVKTETWTTSYYLDDDLETLYPYIDCQADIYNDGTIKVYFWNTHEWDGFATVNHRVNIVGAGFENCNDSFDNVELRYSSNYVSMKNKIYPFKISYHPSIYYCQPTWSQLFDFTYLNLTYNNDKNENRNLSTWIFYYQGSLPELPVNEKKEIIYTPQKEPTGVYNFRIFEHDITISPDILSGNPVSEPQPSASDQKIIELEEKIANLESENASLRAENEQLKNGLISDSYGDINHDNIIDGRDASMLLTYYAKTSTGYTGTLEEYVESVKETESSGSLMDFFSE